MPITGTPMAYRSDLSIGARLLWYVVVIEQMRGGGEPVLLTVDELAKHLGCHTSTAREYRGELVANDLIQLVRSRPGAFYKADMTYL